MLGQTLAEDEEGRARFEREAKADGGGFEPNGDALGAPVTGRRP